MTTDHHPYTTGDRIRLTTALHGDPRIGPEPSLYPGHAGTIARVHSNNAGNHYGVDFDGVTLGVSLDHDEIKPYTTGPQRTTDDIMYDLRIGLTSITDAFNAMQRTVQAAMTNLAPIVEDFAEQLERARRLAAETDVCEECHTELPRTEFEPDRNGDPVCGDCRASHAGMPDA